MLSGLDSGCVVAVLTESSLSLFPVVEFLTCSSRNKLNGFRDYVLPVCVLNEQVDMVRRYYIIQYHQTITLPRLIQPLQPTMTVFGKFKQKFSLVTPMGNMPDMSRNVMTFRSCQPRLPISIILGPKKPLLPCFKPSFYLHVLCYQMLVLARPPFTPFTKSDPVCSIGLPVP